MHLKDNVASPAAQGASPLVRWWIVPINVVAAIAAGLWIPVRIVYLSHTLQVALVDHLIDVGVLALMIANHWPRFRRNRPAAAGGAIGSSRWALAVDGLVALPLFTLLAPSLGPTADYALLLKLLLIRHLFSLRRLLDEFADLHPVLARLLPLGFIVPIVVNLLACGWSALGSATAGSAPNRMVDYIRAVYWTITTLATVGYGDITAKTPVQMIYAAATMLAGIGFFGYVLGNVTSLFARLDAAREQYLELLDRVESFMRSNDVPAPLRTRVREYYRYLWRSRKGWDVIAVLADLPLKLRVEVGLFLNAEIIDKVPVLKGAHRRLLEEIVLELKPRVVIPGEDIFRAGEPGDAMYFIQRGEIEIAAADGTVLATLGPGSFFGESALLAARPRNAAARAVGYGNVFMLNRDAFESVLSRHPDFRQQVQAIAATRTGDTLPPLSRA
jgi:voltage-gated potassium channel